MSFLNSLRGLDLSSFLQSVREVIADPTSNLVLAVLLLGIASLVLLILVIFVLFLLAGTSEDEEEAEGEGEEGLTEEERAAALLEVETLPSGATVEGVGETTPSPEAPVEAAAETPAGVESGQKPARKPSRTLAVLGALVVPVLIVAGIAGGYVITAQNRYCESCHANQLAKQTAVDGVADAHFGLSNAHAKARCVACHEGDQVTSAFGNSSDRLRHLAYFVAGRRTGRNAAVDPRHCLSCHERIETTVILDAKRGVKMSHKEPLAAGANCRECHTDQGHVAGAPSPGMSACLRCHDDSNASASCATCHTREPSVAASSNRLFAPQRIVSKGDCGGCHDQKKCDACHGLRMPHDIQFLQYGHSKQAAFDGKKLCWRCHTMGDCGRCHQTDPNTANFWGHTSGRDWLTRHQTIVPPGAVAGCGCHGRSPYVKSGQDYCLQCHPPGIRNRAK